jgi:hypothetical protein
MQLLLYILLWVKFYEIRLICGYSKALRNTTSTCMVLDNAALGPKNNVTDLKSPKNKSDLVLSRILKFTFLTSKDANFKKKKLVPKKYGPKIFGLQKIGPKKFGPKNIGSQKIWYQKKWSQKNGPKKMVPKNLVPKKLDQKNWSQKIGPK